MKIIIDINLIKNNKINNSIFLHYIIKKLNLITETVERKNLTLVNN